MKIRVMGTQEECSAFKELFLTKIDANKFSYSVSDFYPNRGDSNLCRCYIDFNPVVQTQKAIKGKR